MAVSEAVAVERRSNRDSLHARDHEPGWGRVIGTTVVGAVVGGTLGWFAADVCINLTGQKCPPPSANVRAGFVALGAGGGALVVGVPAVIAHAGVDPLWIGAGGAVVGAISGAVNQGANRALGAAEGAAVTGALSLGVAYFNRRPKAA